MVSFFLWAIFSTCIIFLDRFLFFKLLVMDAKKKKNLVCNLGFNVIKYPIAKCDHKLQRF
jgi:hypothetical protein